jgi:flagellar basal body-associated protein FliL
VAEAEAEEEGGKKSKKKLIMMVVAFLVIGLLAAKMTVLKPPPLSPKQKEEKATAAKYALESLCAAANELAPPPAPKPPEGAPAPTTTTTVHAETPVIGPVLTVTSTTLNLADGHFLKIGLALQLPVGSVVADVEKTENWGAITGQVVLNTFANESMADILPTKLREKLRHEVGNEVCIKSEGKATTVYFTEFVAQ